MTTAAVVLAAGSGSRFLGESHKLTADFRGRPLVAWAVGHAQAAGLAETVVITGAAAIEGLLPGGVTVVANPDWGGGLATSLQAAIAYARAVGHDCLVVGLGDQPLVGTEAWVAVGAAGQPIAVATYGTKRGNPVRLHESIWTLLPTEGDAGARLLMATRPDLVGEVPCVGDPADVDTVEDLDLWS